MKHGVHTASWLALFTVFCAASAYAQVLASCPGAQAEAYLEVNNVRARIFNNGALFWRGNPFVYEVPKDGGVNAIFNSSIWIGGLVQDELLVAAARYGHWQFWPGPLDGRARILPASRCR